MCGIAGIVDLTGVNAVSGSRLQRMSDTLAHRGPDEEGAFHAPGIGLASRRLAIVGLADGQQPVANEDGSVRAVFNGEIFDFADIKTQLQANGHVLRTHCDTEVLPHLWEDHQEGMFRRLRGQFAVAIWDARRRRLVLARDRFGIVPLYWTERRSSDGHWLLFASEIRALLASGLVAAEPDVKGIDQVFHALAVPGPSTCIAGVRQLQPGRYLTVDLATTGEAARIGERVYWDFEFPDRGHEDDERDETRLVDRFEALMLAAVERRLRADVPVVSYLSGGVDSSLIVAMAARLRGTPIPAFTVQIASTRFDESRFAATVAEHVKSTPTVLRVDDATVTATYPALIAAAEAPVVDTSSAASLLLAREVHRQGYKVALAGEGSDEWFGGYPWHKAHKAIGWSDAIPGLTLSPLVRRGLSRLVGVPRGAIGRITSPATELGHHSAFHDFYALLTASRSMLFNEETLTQLEHHHPFLELQPDVERMRRWHPINQAAYWGARVHLPGHLLSLKGDRVAMQSSVETRYPFLDEDVFSFVAALHPRWKLRGFRDKYLVRVLAERYLPREIAWRRKAMFRAPLDSFFGAGAPAYVAQLLSSESLAKSGWFDARAVRYWSDRIRRGEMGFRQRTLVELGMVATLATQLWYHTFIDGSLADLPSRVLANAQHDSDGDRPSIETSTAAMPGLMV